MERERFMPTKNDYRGTLDCDLLELDCRLSNWRVYSDKEARNYRTVANWIRGRLAKGTMTNQGVDPAFKTEIEEMSKFLEGVRTDDVREQDNYKQLQTWMDRLLIRLPHEYACPFPDNPCKCKAAKDLGAPKGNRLHVWECQFATDQSKSCNCVASVDPRMHDTQRCATFHSGAHYWCTCFAHDITGYHYWHNIRWQ